MMQFDVSCLKETISTNDDAKKAAESGAAEGTVVWALRQSAGRGRQGRQWQSPEGNLYFSVVLRPKAALRDWGRYSFVVALAISEAVHGFLPEASVELKWPNDVLVNGKKISGILLEAGEGWLVVGVGINVRYFPENPLYPVTSLIAEKADMPPLKDILNKVLEDLGVWYEQMNDKGFAPIRLVWLARARKGVIRVRLPNSAKDGGIQGQFADLDAEGNLCLILADGTKKTISTGDVFF